MLYNLFFNSFYTLAGLDHFSYSSLFFIKKQVIQLFLLLTTLPIHQRSRDCVIKWINLASFSYSIAFVYLLSHQNDLLIASKFKRTFPKNSFSFFYFIPSLHSNPFFYFISSIFLSIFFLPTFYFHFYFFLFCVQIC